MLGLLGFLIILVVMSAIVLIMSPNLLGGLLVLGFFIWGVGGIVKEAADHA